MAKPAPVTATASVSLAEFSATLAPVLVVFADTSHTLAQTVQQRLGEVLAARLVQVCESEHFTGKSGASLRLPAETLADGTLASLVVVGVGAGKIDPLKLGGKTFSLIDKAETVSVLAALPSGPVEDSFWADFVLGMRLCSYKFTRYQTKKSGDETEAVAPEKSAPEKSTGEKSASRKPPKLVLHVERGEGVRKALRRADAVQDGVVLARDLIHEPANILTPEEFARRASALEKLGVEIEVLDEKALKKLGMRALLGVGLGSHQESYVVVMRWNGASDAKAPPVAFIGKGVVFDSGGISIKPAGGMEDMKGDMAGAAAVVGLMHTLASRKARANVLGVIGLVENMPDGKAQRPGDIVTSMSGQTIEIINTDAEGRLVLADLLWYVKTTYAPKFMVNLATLTGAILVALGQDRAGLFTNNDELATRLFEAGEATGERLWRMPLGPEYDTLMDSKFADMKNSGGRFAGSISAAQFLQRFVDGAPWAHLDIAGVALGAPTSETNKSWSPGFGVRLLERLVIDHYEG